MKHREYMTLALNEAKKAFEEGEVPVGAVIVRNGEIIAKTHNSTEKNKSPLCHAELLAVNEALSELQKKYLSDCTLYVTLEPCPMCMGALLHCKIGEIVFGAYDEKTGSAGSVLHLTDAEYFRKPKITGGYMEEECRNLMCDFFGRLR